MNEFEPSLALIELPFVPLQCVASYFINMALLQLIRKFGFL